MINRGRVGRVHRLPGHTWVTRGHVTTNGQANKQTLISAGGM